MTAEEKCKVLKDLLSWAEMTKEQVIYMQERIYAVRTEQGVMIVKASNPQHAVDMVGGACERESRTMSEILKPCPFCGAKETDLAFQFAHESVLTKPCFFVRCRKCGGMIVDTNTEHCLNDVKKTWNRRAESEEKNNGRQQK